MMLKFNLVSFGAKTLDVCQIHALSGRRETRPTKVRTNASIVETLVNDICHKSPCTQSLLAESLRKGSFQTFNSHSIGI